MAMFVLQCLFFFAPREGNSSGTKNALFQQNIACHTLLEKSCLVADKKKTLAIATKATASTKGAGGMEMQTKHFPLFFCMFKNAFKCTECTSKLPLNFPLHSLWLF